jgi:glycosyltransferase involved in cell wall biosynthesis
MKGNRDQETLIVYQGPWNWDFLWNRSQPLAVALAEKCTVVYIDCGPIEGTSAWHRTMRRIPKVRSLLSRWHRGKLVSTDTAVLHFKWTGVLKNAGRANTLDWTRQGYRDLSRALQPLFASHKRHWLLSSRPAVRGLLTLHSWDRILYDLEDPWFSLSWGPGLNRTAVLDDLRRADVVFANGPRTADEYQSHIGRPVYNLPNGIDVWLADALEAGGIARPAGIPPASPPLRAVFVGNINDRIDFVQFRDVATHATGWHFYFVGPESVGGTEGEAWQALRLLPNVSHLPPVKHKEIPAYLHAADALLLPYSKMGGAAMFPAKLLEYVAAMKPVISTVSFGGEWSALPTVQTVNGAAEFISALRSIEVERSPLPDEVREDCRRIIRKNTWEGRAAQLIEAAVDAGRSNRRGSVLI